MKPTAKLLRTAATCLLPALAGSCGERVLLVDPGKPVRLAEPTRAYVYVRDPAVPGQWVKGSTRTLIPAGWDVLPPATRPAPSSKP